MELIDVIDINGNYTGEILSREEIHAQNKLHWEIVVLVVNKQNEILIQRRSANKSSMPNRWEACAGHVDSGETPIAAAQRELQEEIGLRCKQDELNILMEDEINIRDANSNIRRYFWIYANKKEVFVIQKEEVAEIKWIPIDTLIHELENGNDEFVIKKDKNYILEILKEKIKGE